MESLLEKIGWKKMGIILGVITIFGILILIVSLKPTNQDTLTSKTDSTAEKESNIKLPGKSSATLPPEKSENKAGEVTKMYTTPYYQITYPGNFEGTPYTLNSDILSNVKLKDSISQRIIEIVVFKDQTFINTQKSFFNSLGLNVEDIKINSLEGVKYAGKLKQTQLNEIVVLLKKDDYLIRAMTSYQGLTDDNYENVFDGIISGIN